jgi:hypothetical protein
MMDTMTGNYFLVLDLEPALDEQIRSGGVWVYSRTAIVFV